MLRGEAAIPAQASKGPVRYKMAANLRFSIQLRLRSQNAPMHYSVQLKHCTEYNVMSFVQWTSKSDIRGSLTRSPPKDRRAVQRLASTQWPAGCGIIHTEIVCQTPSLDLR